MAGLASWSRPGPHPTLPGWERWRPVFDRTPDPSLLQTRRARRPCSQQRAGWGPHAARYCRTRATVSELSSFLFKGWGAYPDTGIGTMIGKMMIGLAAVAIVSAATTMSASAQQKKITAAIPKQVCETVTVSTQNWGQQTVQFCGPPGGARGQASIKPRQMKSQ